MATKHHTPHQAIESACSAYLFPRAQQLVVQYSWRDKLALRTLRLPAEVFRKKGSTFHISVGDIITPEEIAKHDSIEDLGNFLKAKTYSMRKWK